MKKVFCLIVMLFVVTGCSNTTNLDCKMKDQNSDFDMTQQMSVIFKNDKISSATLNIIYKVKDKNILTSVKESAKTSFKDYNVYKGIKITEKTKKLTYTYSLNLNPKSIPDEVKETLGLNGDDKIQISDNLTNLGYICK